MRRIWLLHLTTMGFFYAFGVVIPVLPVHLSKAFGIELAWVGWIIALMPLAGMLLRPWSGWLTDAWSRKWPVIIGLGLSSLAGLLYFGNFPSLVLGRLVQGLGIALFAPSALAFTSDLAPPEKLSAIMSTRNLLVGSGVMLGTASGGWIADSYGVGAAFSMVIITQLIFVPFIMRLPETLNQRVKQAWWQGYKVVIAIRSILANSIGNMGFAAVFSVLQAFYPLILVDAGYSLTLVGTFFGSYSLTSIISRIPAGYLIKRFGAHPVSLWGYCISIVGLVIFSLFTVPPISFLAVTIMGLGSGMYLPANLVAVSESAPKEVRGSAFSFFTLSWDVGGIIGPGLGSVVASLLGINAVIAFSTVFATMIVICYIFILGSALLPLREAKLTSQ